MTTIKKSRSDLQRPQFYYADLPRDAGEKPVTSPRQDTEKVGAMEFTLKRICV